MQTSCQEWIHTRHTVATHIQSYICTTLTQMLVHSQLENNSGNSLSYIDTCTPQCYTCCTIYMNDLQPFQTYSSKAKFWILMLAVDTESRQYSSPRLIAVKQSTMLANNIDYILGCYTLHTQWHCRERDNGRSKTFLYWWTWLSSMLK